MKQNHWTLVIKPKVSWFEIDLYEIWKYRDLLMILVKRDFISVYKQTILGPLWFVIQPLLTTIVFIVIFDKVAEIPTDGAPSALFYMSGLVIWNYFSICLNKTAVTFSANEGIFGKVYFPRLIVPISNVVSALITFGIQLALLIGLLIYFYIIYNFEIQLNIYIIILPIIILIVASLGLGCGIIISSITTKYRDLVHLITFGIQLLMYATPVIYPLSFFSGNYKLLILLNPLTSLIEIFRFSILGVGEFNFMYLLYSMVFTLFTVGIGIVIFSKVEKSFMDVI